GRTARASSLRALAANVALSAVTVILFVSAAEGLCRLFDHEPPPRPVASYITSWNDGEFYTVKSAATGWPPWEDYNRDGMRDREELFAQADSPTVREAFARFADELRALHAEVGADHARLGLVVLPFRLQVEAAAPLPAVQARIAALCAAEHIPVLDLLPALRP